MATRRRYTRKYQSARPTAERASRRRMVSRAYASEKKKITQAESAAVRAAHAAARGARSQARVRANALLRSLGYKGYAATSRKRASA